MSTKVKALKAGFYGGGRRRPGAVFDIAEGEKLASWMVAVPAAEKDVAAPKGKAKGAGPQTFSEIAKQDAKALTPKGADDLV